MFQIEETAPGKDDELDVLKGAVFEKVLPRLLRPLETTGRFIKACLIYFDLWPGKLKPDVHTGEILIFDSCAFWGHNEADLGCWRAPRYRMGHRFLKGYQNDRNALYALR